MALAKTELAVDADDFDDIAVFTDAEYVSDDNAAALIAALESFDYEVAPFVGTSIEAWNAALSDVSVLFIPDLFWGELRLDPAVAFSIRLFVAEGGTLVVANEVLNYDTEFVNSVFNTNIVNDGSHDAASTGAVEGTTFEDGPATLPDWVQTDGWEAEGLPADAKIFYSNWEEGATVFGFQHGYGQVIMLGWTFEDAAPLGDKDGGWLDVLQSATSLTDHTLTGNLITGGKAKETVSLTKGITGKFATNFDDIISLDAGNDKADGAGGDDFIAGGAGKDKINGGDGDDLLGGGDAKDTLVGGEGADGFLFVTRLKTAGMDNLRSFNKVDGDYLVLSKSVFKKLEIGTLSQEDIDTYLDVSGSGKLSYIAGKTKVAIAKLHYDNLDEGDVIVIA
jgi:Ca2+-binding RTX toxin-like protein